MVELLRAQRRKKIGIAAAIIAAITAGAAFFFIEREANRKMPEYWELEAENNAKKAGGTTDPDAAEMTAAERRRKLLDSTRRSIAESGGSAGGNISLRESMRDAARFAADAPAAPIKVNWIEEAIAAAKDVDEELIRASEWVKSFELPAVRPEIDGESDDELQSALAATEAFFAAEDWKDLARIVRHRERVLPMLESYYSRPDAKLPRLAPDSQLRREFLVDYGGGDVVAFSFRWENGDLGSIALVKDKAGQFRPDWETAVAYSEMSLEQIKAERPTDPQMVRIYVQADEYFNYEFSDDRKWRCFRITDRDSDTVLFGYAEINSPVEQELSTMLKLEQRVPAIVKLAFTPDSKAPDCVLITEFIQRDWFVPDLEETPVAAPEPAPVPDAVAPAIEPSA